MDKSLGGCVEKTQCLLEGLCYMKIGINIEDNEQWKCFLVIIKNL